MFEEKKDFMQLMSERRTQLIDGAQSTKTVAKVEEVAAPAGDFPFKRFRDLSSSAPAVVEPVIPVEAPVDAPETRAAAEMAVETTVVETTDIPTNADIAPAENGAELMQRFYESTFYFAQREIERLNTKVAKSDSVTRDRLTARFGHGNEWRAFADRHFLDVVSCLERLELTQA